MLFPTHIKMEPKYVNSIERSCTVSLNLQQDEPSLG
jgi:hypothetical protein